MAEHREAIPLSNRAQYAVDAYFKGPAATEASELLASRVGRDLPFYVSSGNPSDFDRVRLAAIKHSDGDIEQLKLAVIPANTDWRDLLCCVGFGDDVHAHSKWSIVPKHRMRGRFLPVPDGFVPPDTISTLDELYWSASVIAGQLWTNGRVGNAHRLDSLLSRPWTSSSELVGELHVALSELVEDLPPQARSIAQACLVYIGSSHSSEDGRI